MTTKKEAPEKKETPKEVEELIDGVGLQDPAEVLKQFEDPFAETEVKDEVISGIPGETDDEEDDKETPADETKDEETKDEPEKQEEKKEEPAKEPSELELAKADAETWKKRYSDSQTEFQTNLKPQIDTLTSEKEALAQERREIAEVLKSDPELLDAFVRAANNPNLAKTEPAKVEKPVIDKESLEAAIKATFGPDALSAITDASATRKQARIDAIDKFDAAHPGLTDEEKGKLAQVAGTLEVIQKIPLGEALDRAYLAQYPDKAFEAKSKEIEENAKITAIRNRESAQSRTSGGSTGNNAPTALTPQELMTARKLNMSEKDYLEYKVKANS